MKTCTNCNQPRPECEFGWRNKEKGTRQSHCKICNKDKAKKHYTDNKEYYAKKRAKNNKKYRESNKRSLLEYLLDHPCVDCGEKNPIFLEFDHRDDKKCDVSLMVQQAYSWQAIEEEIKKCDVRCVKCHRLKTYKECNWFGFDILKEMGL